MSDTLRILLLMLIVSTVTVLACYWCYRRIRKHWTTIVSQMSAMLGFGDASENDWDRGEILCRVIGSTSGFLIAEYLVLWITIGIASDGLEGLHYEVFFSLWYVVISSLDGIFGIVGAIGVLCGTIFGVHQDLQSRRLATLAGLGIFGSKFGLGLRFD